MKRVLRFEFTSSFVRRFDLSLNIKRKLISLEDVEIRERFIIKKISKVKIVKIIFLLLRYKLYTYIVDFPALFLPEIAANKGGCNHCQRSGTS